jgi:pSer/pThr/pTyr-binding forkhead associated (FHA) protein
MAEESQVAPEGKGWLLSQADSGVNIRFLIPRGTTRIGRAPDNELVIHGANATTVSLHHAEIERDGEIRIRDLESTNGTFVNGERTSEAVLAPNASIRLGSQGPELLFVLDEPERVALNETLVIPDSIASEAPPPPPSSPVDSYEGLLSEGVERARRARAGASGSSGHTLTIMREALDLALKRSGRRFVRILTALAMVLIAVSGFAAWKIAQLNREKGTIDAHIREIEAQLQKATSTNEADRLVTQLDTYEGEGEQLEHEFAYRVGYRDRDFVTAEIRRLLAEFGAEVYSVPPEFTERVKHYDTQYEGPDKSLMARALTGEAGHFATMRTVLEEEHLPPDLAYVPLVESALGSGQSTMGATGPWQLTPATAKALGLSIGPEVDERNNVVKSTHAACHYLRQLIVDFGTGSSVMLALAAYNGGPAKVKQAVEKTVSDPFKQRNFWYLYRVRALPAETREYVPKVIAVMIIARNPGHFGFGSIEVAKAEPQSQGR